MNRVWHVNKEIMICGQRPASFVRAQAGKAHGQPTNNWQSVGQRAGFTTSVVHVCQRPRTMSQPDNDGEVSQVSIEIGQSGTN